MSTCVETEEEPLIKCTTPNIEKKTLEKMYRLE
jgi:hypothetical protein